MKKIYSITLLISVILFSCERNNINSIEDECYFKGIFGTNLVLVNHGDGIYFSNNSTYVIRDNSFTYGCFIELCNFEGVDIPRLKVEFRNQIELNGQYSNEKINAIFPSLFEVGKYRFVTTHDELNEIGISIEYRDINGNVWNSISTKNEFANFEIIESEIVNSDYYCNSEYIKCIKGKFSCVLFNPDYTEKISVENIEFQYLLFSE